MSDQIYKSIDKDGNIVFHKGSNLADAKETFKTLKDAADGTNGMLKQSMKTAPKKETKMSKSKPQVKAKE